MKIGIVCPYNMFTFSGGVQEIVKIEYEYLKSKGHDVKIITPRPFGFADSVDNHYILLGRSTKIATPQKTMVDFGFKVKSDEILSILDGEAFDVLHFHEPAVPMLSRQILNIAECPSVGTLHAAIPDGKFNRSLTSSLKPYVRGILQNLTALTAVSHAAAEYFSDVFGEHEAKIIPNTIELSTFSESTELDPKYAKLLVKNRTILYLGRLEKRKSVDLLIEAFAELKSKYLDDAILLIAGKGSMQESLLDDAENLGVDQSVKFLGYIEDDQKAALLKSVDLYVSPATTGESFGLVLLEAMAANTPMVVGNNPGYLEVMDGLGNLSVLNPNDVSTFARRMNLFLTNEKLREMMVNWGEAEIKKYELVNIMSQYEQVLLATVKTS